MILNQTWNLFYESPGTTIVGWESAIYSIGNFFCDTQYQGSARPDLDHQDRDWKCLSLNGETETEKVWVSMTRLRLKMSQYQWQDQNRDLKGLSLNEETETEIE